jgi:hypothetical protein
MLRLPTAVINQNTGSAPKLRRARSRFPSRCPTRPRHDPRRAAHPRSRTRNTPPAISTFGAGAPSRDECARERRIREIDRDCVIEHPAHPGWRHRPAHSGAIPSSPSDAGGSGSGLAQISAGGPVRITAAATEAGQAPRRADHLATVGAALGRRSALRTPHLPSH